MHLEFTAEDLATIIGFFGRKDKTADAADESLPPMKWTQSVYQNVLRDIADHPPERGGILLGPSDQRLATHFVFDKSGVGTNVSWTFGHVKLNELVRQYVALRLDVKGFIHSHPSAVTALSNQDLRDFRKPFGNPKNGDLVEVWAPLVVDGSVYPYILFREKLAPSPAQLVLV